LIFTANLGRTIISPPKSLLSSVNEDGIVTDWSAPSDGIAMVECGDSLDETTDLILALEVGEIAGIVVCLIWIICLLVACGQQAGFCLKKRRGYWVGGKRASAAQEVQLQSREVYGIAPANLDKKAGPLKQGSVVNFEGAEWVVQYINSKGMLDLKHVTSSSVAYEQTPAAYGQPAYANDGV
jgi:hypothetical protein